MSALQTKQLHWTQRVALVRHNLHIASRTGDFSFFRTLQAAGLMEGTNHAATLSATIGDDADAVLAAMDNLNQALAYVYQDAFKTCYDNLKNNMRDDDKEADKSKLYVDITMQRSMAGMGIDKLCSSAIGLVNQQPEHVQDTTANIWITGVTLVSDSIEVTLQEMYALDRKLNDFIRLEESWNTVKSCVVGSITALKGVFSFLDPSNPQETPKSNPRSSSIASTGGNMLRRISSAFLSTPGNTTSAPQSRNASITSTTSIRLKVQIPSEQSGDEGGTASAPDESSTGQLTTGPQQQQQQQQGPPHGVVLPPPSPSAGTLLSAGAQGPPNPFARPAPPMSTNPHAMNREHIETPISALPSRFMSDNLLPSPSTFYPEWGFGRSGDSNMLPSPLNFQTPVVSNGQGWREEDRKRQNEDDGYHGGGDAKRPKT